MMKKNKLNYPGKKFLVSSVIILLSLVGNAQSSDPDRISIGLHFDPVISWFGADIRQVDNEGARPGFNFGLTFNKYFSYNYAFSAGLNIISAGGRLIHTDTTILEFANLTPEILPGNPVVYKIQYISIPVGLKLQTNQIGYVTFFSDLGIDPKAVIGGKIDIPSVDISGEKATTELKTICMSYHITAGIEYSLGGTTAAVFGLNFENIFTDITKETGVQPKDKITHKMLGFRLGLIF
jgi:hypothetical protein